MIFLSPYYLWGFAGLLVPVIIHFWSRKNPEVILFSSVRFLPGDTTTRSFSLHLSERWLLLLRLLAISLLVLILARPALPGPGYTRAFLLIDPLLANHPDVGQLVDTTDLPARFLTAGFPDYDPQKVPSDPYADVWSLVMEASREADSLVVVAADLLVQYQGKKPATGLPVQWLTFPVGSSVYRDTLFSFTGSSGNPAGIIAVSDAGGLTFRKEPVEAAGKYDSLVVVIQSREGDQTAVVVEMATQSIAEFLDVPVRILHENPTSPSGADWLVWLDTTRVAGSGAKRILKLSAPRPGPSLLTTEDPDIYLLNGAPEPDASEFLEGWAGLLDAYRLEESSHRTGMTDRRRMTFDPVPQFRETAALTSNEKRPFIWPFLLLFLVILLTERYISQKRHA